MDERFLCRSFQSEAGTPWLYDAVSNRLLRLKGAASREVDISALKRKLIQRGQIMSAPPAESIAYRADLDTYRQCRDGLCARLTLEITQACNLRCAYCVYSGKFPGWRAHGPGSMTMGIAERAIRQFAHLSRRRSPVSVCFYGGESTLRFDMIRELTELARKECRGEVYIHIGSNGTLLNDAMMDWIAGTERVYLDVTMNGSLHDRFRVFPDGSPSLPLIRQNLRRFHARYPSVAREKLNYICNGYSWQDMEALRRDYAQEGIVPAVITSIDAPPNDPSFPPPTEADARAFRRLKWQYIERDDPFLSALFDAAMLRIHNRDGRPLGDRTIIEGTCMPGLTNLFVTWDGSYRLCEKCAGPELGTTETGVDWHRAEALMRDYAQMLSARCADCWAQRLCTVCYRDLSGDGGALAERVCEGMRQQVSDDLALYASICEEAPARLKGFDQAVVASFDTLDAALDAAEQA